MTFDAESCGACHGGRRASEDTRVLAPVDTHPRKSADKPVAIRDDMAQIPAGPFIMGYDKRHPDEGPMHTETIEH
jgi:formylglycine-generating enzyme required for sulfatase activity